MEIGITRQTKTGNSVYHTHNGEYPRDFLHENVKDTIEVKGTVMDVLREIKGVGGEVHEEAENYLVRVIENRKS